MMASMKQQGLCRRRQPAEKMERWVEHYSELYSRHNTVRNDALDAVECLPILEELDIEPTMEVFIKGFDALAAGKAPGKDGIPPDIMQKTLCWNPYTNCSALAGEKVQCLMR